MTEYGTLENVVLAAGMSDAAAIAKARTTLAESAWPRSTPPQTIQTSTQGDNALRLTFYGHVFNTRNKYSLITGTATASAHVTALIAACEFIRSGAVATNSMSFQIDDRAPLRIWRIIRDITLAGDASGNRWQCGVYANRIFEYRQSDTTFAMRFRAGKILNVAGGVLEPWFAEPGLLYLDDLPLGPGNVVVARATVDPHTVMVEEVEFDAGDYLAGGAGLRMYTMERTE